MMLRPIGVRNGRTGYFAGLTVTGNVTVVGSITATNVTATGFHMQSLSAGANLTIPAGYGVYVPDTYEIPAAFTVEIAASAVLEIG